MVWRNLIKSTEGTVGYVEVAYAIQNKLLMLLKNKAGNFVDPTLDALTAAASGAKPDDNLVTNLIDQADPNAWPITTTTYAIIPQDMTDAGKAPALLVSCTGVHTMVRLWPQLTTMLLCPKALLT